MTPLIAATSWHWAFFVTGALGIVAAVVWVMLYRDPVREQLSDEERAYLDEGQTLEAAPKEERTDPGLMQERVKVEVQRLFKKRAGRRPLVLPIVLEV